MDSSDATCDRSEGFVIFSTFGSPVPYLPQAAAIFVTRQFGIDVDAMLLLDRFAVLIAYIALVWAAIKRSPRSKWALCAVGPLPVAVFQARLVGVARRLHRRRLPSGHLLCTPCPRPARGHHARARTDHRSRRAEQDARACKPATSCRALLPAAPHRSPSHGASCGRSCSAPVFGVACPSSGTTSSATSGRPMPRSSASRSTTTTSRTACSRAVGLRRDPAARW